MRVAICGYPPFALQVQEGLKNSNIEFKFFIRDFVSNRGGGELSTNLPPITFFEFRRLVNAGELDGVIIAEDGRGSFTKNVVRVCKFYDIPKVCTIDSTYAFNPFKPLSILDSDKAYVPYLETNITDGCNFNCKGCTHFSGLFRKDEIYPLENFRRDLRRIAQVCDVRTFRLLGGEPFLLKNFDEYIKISRNYLPNTHIQLVTNGALIPTTSQKILDAIRENECSIEISAYAPTLKIADKIKTVLDSNRIKFQLDNATKDKFTVFLNLHEGSNPEKARGVCFNDSCRFLRDGKIYKCPIDALKFRLAERFKLKHYPKATGVDIYSPNFSSLLEMLDGNVEMCHWCAEQTRQISWKTSNNPKLEDWLADPAELQNFR